MNNLDRLKLEFKGIEGIISDYTEDRRILNYLAELKNGIHTANLDTTIYCLDALIDWYNAEMPSINSSSYVYCPEIHGQTLDLLQEIRSGLRKEDFISNKEYSIANAEEFSHSNEKAIFISHNSSDKAYGDALRDYIIGLGVKDEQLVYTSHPMNKIPLDVNIYDYLKQHINAQIFMVFLWSDSYLESPACMNEMGAAWVVQADYTNIYVPSFSFGNPKYHQCAVDTRKMGAVLNGDQHCKASMIELKNKIQAMFDLKNDEKKANYLLDNFIQEITEASHNG